MGSCTSDYDLAVVGAGMGGLATAVLAQSLGLRVALLEAHTKLGGCAGYFRRGPYTFDVGATALMGLGGGEPVGDLLRIVGLEVRGQPTPAYRVHLPDRSLDILQNAGAFERNVLAAFPGRAWARRAFWRLQAAVGQTLFRAASHVPRFPVRSMADLLHDVRILGLRGMLAGSTAAVTVRDALRVLGLHDDTAFCALVTVLLEDTAQSGPETIPFANAAACLQAYRRGMSRPHGGMRALVDGLGQRFAALRGDLRLACLVDRVEPAGSAGWYVRTDAGHEASAPGRSRSIFRSTALPRC